MRALVISDVHANLTALDAVLRDAGEFDQVWCLGDIVGYGPQPNECISRLREFHLISLAGNHDLAVTGKTPLYEFTDRARDNLAFIETPVCLNGHSHMPVMFRKPWDGLKILEEPLRANQPVPLTTYDQVFLNPGSVGQPRDEDPRASYALVDLEAMTFTLRRVQYDFTVTQKLMKQAKLPDRLIRRLRFGQ